MCDDASTDNTLQIAKEYEEKYPDKILAIQNEKNFGLSFTLNHCLEHATGTFVVRMDGDDLSAPERLETERNFLMAHPEFDLVGCAMQRFGYKLLGLRSGRYLNRLP